MAENPLANSIQFIKGVGPKLAQTLSRKGIATFEDALYYLPRDYEDRRRLTPIRNLVPGQSATVMATVINSRQTRIKRMFRFECVVSDGTGSLQLFWFKGYPSLATEFKNGAKFLIHGEITQFGGIPRIVHPDYEPVRESSDGKPIASVHFGRIVPIYSETEGLNQKLIRRIVGDVLRQAVSSLIDPLPDEMRQRLNLPALRESFIALHFPKELPKENELSAQLKRIVFEEFFILQLGLGLKKKKLKATISPKLVDDKGWLPKFVAGLPFPLTDDQKLAIADIARDIGGAHTMTRLVQGDVGAGKTVVALAAAAIAGAADHQTALMAPTEILAQQHFRTAQRFLEPLGIECALLVSAAANKKEVQARVASGEIGFVVGTQALFQGGVKFHRLGLVVVDEQHRFGVEQRGELVRKGTGGMPHMLMMTATPIPRTLAFTLYGDLDLTIIRQKPAERKPIRTMVIRDRERPRIYKRMRDAVERGEQVYVIYPLVEESEKLELKSATQMYDQLRKEIFPDLKLGLLHGRMKPEEKEGILSDFKAGKFQILVSTTVIEVGIDVPNATLMVIEHPERLGLSQLHQLRGRVGRGKLDSECILVADEYVGPRLKVMESTEDGFVIAEEDLKIRGPGEFLGTRQSGLPGFRVGHILRDASLLGLARDEAQKLLDEDPDITEPGHAGIRRMLESRWKDKIERLRGA